MKKNVISLFFVLGFCFSVFAQSSEILDELSAKQNLQAEEFSANVQTAMSNPNYIVTAGDVYSLNYSADDIIFGFEKNNKQKHVNNINIEANRNNVKGDNNIVSTKDSNIQLDQHIKQLLDLIQIQQMQINNLISSKNIT